MYNFAAHFVRIENGAYLVAQHEQNGYNQRRYKNRGFDGFFDIELDERGLVFVIIFGELGRDHDRNRTYQCGRYKQYGHAHADSHAVEAYRLGVGQPVRVH